ncbi:calcium permeable stress-gated cation channel [Nematocida minor]|uniref:calcium permeable stress-gated cation channel n=1 Tax=Nematocida minor TaxID=1912983 RepID=UPI00221E7695|nr:calcium permeable stress-gated cation channel [Nematocida minor]XP_051332071.1 calcium permeable stress-gated cation channel [Nematocida minor]KAI5188801.1 calcium permeable stress-gated cation channel [Nematocida minor]KAI5188905.1 calcium permeable stress-gated cation channel [Nematocida minor]
MAEEGKPPVQKRHASLEIVSKPSLLDADNTIRLALVFQLGISFAIFCVFIFCRKKIPWMYSTNTKRYKKHPAAVYKGALDWIVPVFRISDTVFFELVGFDAFLFVETLKLLGTIFLFLSIVLFPALGAYYFFFAQSKISLQIIMNLSFLSTSYSPRHVNCIVPCLGVWFVTAVIIYFLYIFYRKYVILRQLHIRDRVFSKSTPSIKKMTDEMKSFKNALNEINICSRTVLITNLPKFIVNKKDLLYYLKVLGVSVEPENAHLVTNTKTLEELNSMKKAAIISLEKEMQKFFMRLNFLSIDTGFFEKHIENYDSTMDLISNAIAWKKAHPVPKEQYKEELDHLVDKAFNGKFFDVLQKINESAEPVKIAEFVANIKALTEKIEIEREKASKASISDELLFKAQNNSELHDRYDIDGSGSIFMSTMSILNVKRAYINFINSIPLGAHNGFVTFKETKDASFLRMSLIGSGTFSCKAIEAPPPDLIIWTTLTDTRVRRVVKKILGTIITVVFVSLFILLVFFVSTIINIDTFDSIVTAINPELSAIIGNSNFRKTFQGIIVPTVYSQFISIAPSILWWICVFEGSISKIEFQKSFTKKYSIFLFFNGFLVLIFGTSIAGLVYSTKQTTWTIEHLVSTPVVSSSIFFLNLLIHKTFGGLMSELLQIPRLLSWVLAYILGGVFTRREEIKRFDSQPINFGSLYPQVFLLFPMILIYSIICPLFMPIGCLYFFGAFAVYKSLFLYSHESQLESGGEHWPSLFTSIFYSLIIFHAITLVYFVSHKQYITLLLILPLIVITIGVWKGFTNLISKNCYFLPNNNSENIQSNESIKKLFELRKEDIQHWKESSNVEKDIYYLQGEKLHKDKDVPYVYKDLSFLPSISAIILPNWFYITLLYLRDNGESDVFGLEKKKKSRFF